MAFGYWVDNAIGGEGGSSGDDEVGYFDIQLDLAYSWDHNATGFGGVTPGIMGFAFLESGLTRQKNTINILYAIKLISFL